MHASTLTFHQERILAVLLHIQRHLDEDLSLEGLAKVAHLSAFHMHRIFKALVGEGVAEHVRRLRLERAAIQLKYGRASVLELALEAGFESHEAFTRAFSALMGMPPSRYRKTNQERLFQAVPSGVHYDPHGALEAFQPQLAPCPHLDVQPVLREPAEVCFVRRTGCYYQSAPQAWDRLLELLGGLPEGTPEACGICHDDPLVTPEARLRYDATLPWHPGVPLVGELGRQTLAGGLYLSLTRWVPLADHDAAWSDLLQWVLHGAYVLRLEPSLEVYHGEDTQEGPEGPCHEVTFLLPVEPGPRAASHSR